MSIDRRGRSSWLMSKTPSTPVSVMPSRNLDLGHGLLSGVLQEKYASGLRMPGFISCKQTADAPELHSSAIRMTSGHVDRCFILVNCFPPLQETLRLVNTGFEVCYRLQETVSRDELRAAIDKLFDVMHDDPEFSYSDWFTLLAAFLAFAHAFDAQGHGRDGCSPTMTQSLAYLDFAETNLQVGENGPASLTQLRSVVVIMLFKALTQTPEAAYDHLASACNATCQLGLYERYSYSETIKDDANTPMQNLFWIILYLDMYICALLDRRTFFTASSSNAATLVVMQRAARNVTNVVRSSHSFLQTVGLALQIELFKIAKAIARLEPCNSSLMRWKLGSKNWEEVERLRKELDEFKDVVDAIFPPGEVVRVVARERFELLMTHCTVQILLSFYCDSLGFAATTSSSGLSPSPSSSPPPSRRNRMRDLAAIAAINETIAYAKGPGDSPLSQPSAYFLFVSIVCLTVSMSDASDTNIRNLLANKIQAGHSLMLRLACPMHAATFVYLHDVLDLGNRCGALAPDGTNIVNTTPTLYVPPTFVDEDELLWHSLQTLSDVDNDLARLPTLHQQSSTPTSTSLSSSTSVFSTTTPGSSMSPLMPQDLPDHSKP